MEGGIGVIDVGKTAVVSLVCWSGTSKLRTFRGPSHRSIMTTCLLRVTVFEILHIHPSPRVVVRLQKKHDDFWPCTPSSRSYMHTSITCSTSTKTVSARLSVRFKLHEDTVSSTLPKHSGWRTRQMSALRVLAVNSRA